MSNIEIKDIRSKVGSIFLAIEEYIKSTDHWLYYWINEPKIKEFIQDDPNEYVFPELQDMVNDAKAVPLSKERKVIISGDRIFDILDEEGA